MEHPDSTDAECDTIASVGADYPESSAGSPANDAGSEPVSARPSAIERQIAAISANNYDDPIHLKHADRNIDRHNSDLRTTSYKRAKFLAVIFLLAAIGMVLSPTEAGRHLRQTAGAAALAAMQTASTYVSVHASDATATAHTSASSHSLATAHAPPTVKPIVTNSPSPPKELAENSTESAGAPAVLSVPITDVSLRNSPDLLEQLVQIYRAQLADNPNNSTAITALDKLRERSLSELQTIISQGNDATIVKSLAIFSRLFPEMADNTRYKYLVSRMDYMHRESKTNAAARPDTSMPQNTVMPSMPTTVSPPADSAPAKEVVADASQKNVSPAAHPVAETKKTADVPPSTKPEIRDVSITPGTLVEDRFVPSADGGVLMVEISYRNFGKVIENETDATLIARLGVPGDSAALAEAPVDISGDRGTKSFFMETLVPGGAGEKYRLNFILNGEFLTSRTVRLSMPER